MQMTLSHIAFCQTCFVMLSTDPTLVGWSQMIWSYSHLLWQWPPSLNHCRIHFITRNKFHIESHCSIASQRLKHEEASNWVCWVHLSGFLSSAVQIGQITWPGYFLELFWISFATYDYCHHINRHHIITKATSNVYCCQSGDFTFLWLKAYHYWRADRRSLCKFKVLSQIESFQTICFNF